MTYVNKKTRVFMERGDFKPERRRSEARLKTYPSAIDLRAWCDDVEDRRQHILELVQKGVDKCKNNIIPLEAIFDTIMADKNEEVSDLKNRAFPHTPPEAQMRGADHPDDDNQGRHHRQHHPGHCPAEKRHQKERHEVEQIIDMDKSEHLPSTSGISSYKPTSYSVKAPAPVKISTKVKGIRPGFQIIPGNIATKATVRNAYPANKNIDQVPEPEQLSTSEVKPYQDEKPTFNQPLRTSTPKVERSSKIAEEPSNTEPAPKSTKRDNTPKVEDLSEPENTQSPQESSKQKQPEPRSMRQQSSDAISAVTGLFAKKPSSQNYNDTTDAPIVQSNYPGTSLKFPDDWRESKTLPVKTEPQSPESDNANKRIEELEKKIDQLQDELAARDALCNEQQASIKGLQAERDKLNERMQDCLKELEKLKKMDDLGNPVIPKNCKEEIEALEHEMQIMRSGNPSPEQEAEFIKKEIDILKRYCLKLKTTEDENEKLKVERDQLKSQVNIPERPQSVAKGDSGNTAAIIKERDTLANKVQKLEKELLQYQDLPEDVDVYKDRSKMLDNALEERDALRKQVEEMQKKLHDAEDLRRKADRVDELEGILNRMSKNGRSSDYQLQKTLSKCGCLEKDLQNCKYEKDAMYKRIDYMQKELDQLRARTKETEMLRLDRDRLQIKLNELSHVQAENETLFLRCKCLERSAMERDAYKQRYESILSMECQCEILKAGAEEAHAVARERDQLIKQVHDLETCIHEQEDEIKQLSYQIESLLKNKDETQARMKEAISHMKAEVDRKDSIIASSEEQLMTLQAQLKGGTGDTSTYKTKIEELEKQLYHAQSDIRRLQQQLKDKEVFMKGAKVLNKSEMDAVSIMRRELEAAKTENKKLQEIANKMRSITGDEHVQKMLRQSECAVRRVVEELGKQYREWDSMRHGPRSVLKTCPCHVKQPEAHSDSEAEQDKLREELEDIQREKSKLESLVRQIQNDKGLEGPQKEMVSLRLENSKLRDNLRKETEARKVLERKLIK